MATTQGNQVLPPSPTPDPATLLKNNQAWAASIQSEYPGFLAQTARGQAPRVFWIGCSDSRVPESVITNVFPGAIFVHRNVANQFLDSDVSIQAALGFATDEPEPEGPGGLGAKHVVVVGHSGCGGVGFAMSQATGRSASELNCECMAQTPALERWLGPLIGLAREHSGASLDEMIEFNVATQVHTVRMALIESGKSEIAVHGWVYDLGTGLLRELALPLF